MKKQEWIIALRIAFEHLRKDAREGNGYWADRDYSEIIGMVRIIWYARQITEKQYNEISNIALEIAIFGHCRPSKERKAA